jgi:DNA-binding LytR/AlgR family response regulator
MPNPGILIVEDDPIIAADLEDRLLEMGYGITGSVRSGEAALDLLQSEMPDLALLDIQLKGELDGVETAEKIVKTHTFPLIFLTSNSDEATFARAKSVQPHAFLSKPFRGRDLRHAIELALGHSGSASSSQTSPSSVATNTLQDCIFIKTNDLQVKVRLRDILWVEAYDYYCKIVTNDQTHLATLTLKKFHDALQNDDFMRVHRSYIVNLNRIDKIGVLSIYIGKHKIPLAKSYSTKLLERLRML